MKIHKGKRAVLYIQSSTTEQRESGFSITDQEDYLTKFCNVEGIEIVKKYVDNYSAITMDSSKMNQLKEFVSKDSSNVDFILAHSWDRFSRNALHVLNIIEEFKGYRIEINCLDSWIDYSNPNHLMTLLFSLAIPPIEDTLESE